MLGRPAESSAIEFWASAASADTVITGVSASTEYKRRLTSQVAEAADGDGGPFERLSARRQARLLSGEGLTALDDPPEGSSWPDVLRTLPFGGVGRDLTESRAAVLGPYAKELAEELVARAVVTTAEAGLQALRPEARPDVVVFTDPSFVTAMLWSHPHVLERVSRRLVTPVLTGRAMLVTASESELTRQRQQLHQAGFVEVVRLIFRPFSGDELVLDVTHSRPGGFRHRQLQALDPRSLPLATWLVAERRPRLEGR